MNLGQGMFAVKLCQLEQQYGLLQSRLRLCQEGSHEKIRCELQKAADEYKETDLLLQSSVEASRSPAVSALAQAQITYCRNVEQLLKEELPEYLHSEDSVPGQDQAEAAALFAEYAVDFATQSMRYALWAALSALDLQMIQEEKRRSLL